jgi:hypothetical protein
MAHCDPRSSRANLCAIGVCVENAGSAEDGNSGRPTDPYGSAVYSYRKATSGSACNARSGSQTRDAADDKQKDGDNDIGEWIGRLQSRHQEQGDRLGDKNRNKQADRHANSENPSAFPQH